MNATAGRPRKTIDSPAQEAEESDYETAEQAFIARYSDDQEGEEQFEQALNKGLKLLGRVLLAVVILGILYAYFR